jgi:hypothetical protein
MGDCGCVVSVDVVIAPLLSIIWRISGACVCIVYLEIGW